MRGGGDRPRIRLDLNGMQVDALVDTGSTHTIVNYCIYQHLPRLTPLYAAPRVQSITNHELPIRGACTVRIGGIPTEVLVCDSLGVDLLIGSNLCQYACVIDFPRRLIQLGDKQYNMITTHHDHCPIMATSSTPKTDSTTINNVLRTYEDVFSSKRTPVNVARSLQPAVIDTGDVVPIRQNPYRLPFSKRQKVEECINEMLTDGIIRPSTSPWASPITLVPKKDGSTRFCIDYRKLNAETKKDAYPLPHIQDIFDSLQGAKVFSTLDLRSGYWQVPMEEGSISKTAFSCHLGLFEFVRLPFGLTNAPGIFQRAMSKVLSGLIGRSCMVYIDDIIVFSRSEAEHAHHLSQVFDRIREAGLQLKPPKCHFNKDRIELLGYVVSANGIHPQEAKTEVIRNMVAPADKAGVQSFLGMVGYYRQCVPGFATLAEPLTEVARPKSDFKWGPDQQQSFDRLKEALISAPILVHPDPTRPYALYTDASNTCIGAILVQKDDRGVERVIHYLSHKLSGSQLNWPTIEKEAYAIVYALKKLHVYLWGATFEIYTDHKPLRSLFKDEIKNSKLSRWAMQISEYQAPILYHQGKLNVRADMLSRIASVTPLPDPEPTLDLPTVWETDHIDPLELVRLQHEQFPDYFIEASQGTDETRYIVEKGLLYTMAEPHRNAGIYPRLILPQQFRQQVVDRCHAEIAHARAEKTLMRVQENYVWPGMRRAVREYITACVHCNTLVPHHPAYPRGKIPTPPRPFHTWGMDLVGPFCRDQRGRQYLLTCVDHLTGWAEAIPIASKKSATVWDAFVVNIVARYGIPSVLITDNGGEFTERAFKEWLQDHGIHQHFTSPYHPQSNGMTERFNGTIQKLLLKLTGGDEKKWSRYLGEALYAYRITAGKTGISPYQAVYGQRPRLPRATTGDQDEGDRLQAIRTATDILHHHRMTTREAYQSKEPARSKRLPPGTFVSVRVLNPRKGQPRWQPGYRILSSYDGGLRVENLTTKRVMRVNQRNAREIPESKAYEEVDPLPRSRKKSNNLPPQEAHPIPKPDQTPLHMPAVAQVQAFSMSEWNAWCNHVRNNT